jgi:TolB protein
MGYMNMIRRAFVLIAGAAAVALPTSIDRPVAACQDGSPAVRPQPARRHPQVEPGRQRGSQPWREAEAAHLRNPVQLTFGDRFYRAGEGYFSPDRSKFAFQAVPVPPPGEEPASIYDMYLADVAYDANGTMTGLENLRRVSPEGSANTCAWFDPNDSNMLYFGSTITAPSAAEPPGFQRTTGRYKWMFPPEMRIVRYDLRKPAGDPESLEIVIGNETAYQAEDALNPDGRFMVYCNLDTGDGDLYIHDFRTGRDVGVVRKPGYDGGPFFSPDGTRICYRSDRHGDNLLQIFVADLKFDRSGSIVGIEREYQLTNNLHVNWAPYWHPSGRFIVYATSKLGHYNYEVFIVDADPGNLRGSEGPIRYGTHQRRVTFAPGADVLPIFSNDGRYLTWTSKRSGEEGAQLWAAEFIMPLEPEPSEGRFDIPRRQSGS